MNYLISLNKINKDYISLQNQLTVLKDISFDIKENEFLIIIGQSGCGKSTLLNIISKLENESGGKISYKENIRMGYMLQDDALFPWLNILDNTLLGLKINHSLNNETKKYAQELLEIYGLKDFMYKYPSELSGGMKKRVALIRTLVTKPDILLLDEPFSSLDYTTRIMVSDDVYNIIKKEKKTAIMVTHDLNEAITFASRIIVLDKRPATIKNMYEINLEGNSPSKKLDDPNFSKYYNLIWRDMIE